ncbi:hypothetical protein [Thermostilla marina]
MTDPKRSHWQSLAQSLGLPVEQTTRSEDAQSDQQLDSPSDQNGEIDNGVEDSQASAEPETEVNASSTDSPYPVSKAWKEPTSAPRPAASWVDVHRSLGLEPPPELLQAAEAVEEAPQEPAAVMPEEPAEEALADSDATADLSEVLSPVSASTELLDYEEPPLVATVSPDLPEDTPVVEASVLPPGDWHTEESASPSIPESRESEALTPVDATAVEFYDEESAFKASTLFDEDDLPSVRPRKKRRRSRRRKKVVPVEEDVEPIVPPPSVDEIETIDELDTSESGDESSSEEVQESPSGNSSERKSRRRKRSKSSATSDADREEKQEKAGDKHRGIPTWSETVGVVIESNMKSREGQENKKSQSGRRRRRR